LNKPKAQAAQQLHAWSKEALLAKAQRFAEEMLKHPRDDWRFALWGSPGTAVMGCTVS
jgi:hypothetical protein